VCVESREGSEFGTPAGGIRVPRPQYLIAMTKAGTTKARIAARQGLALTAPPLKNAGERDRRHSEAEYNNSLYFMNEKG